MSKKKSKGKSPSTANLRKQSDPRTIKDQKQAIKDDLRGEIISYLQSLTMEQLVFAKTMNRVLGQGGDDLIDFVKQLEKGYSDVSNKLETLETEDSPSLKKYSREAVVESILKSELELDSKSEKPKKPKSKK